MESWALLTNLYSVAGPSITLLYPLYASVCAMESPSEVDKEQWLAYGILYSFITLLKKLADPVLYWIPVWYPVKLLFVDPVKLLFVAWLVLPQFKGASFIYDKFVREQLRKYRGGDADHKVHILKVPTIIIKVDLDRASRHREIGKVLDKIREDGEFDIDLIHYDERNNKVNVKGPFDADKLADKLRRKAGKIIKEIEIVEPPPPPPPKKEEPAPPPPPAVVEPPKFEPCKS